MLAMAGPLTAGTEAAPDVQVEGTGSSVTAHATIRIHASREAVWAYVSSCPKALKIVPSLKGCEVLEIAPDASWERIRQVMEYVRFLPNVRFEVKVSFVPPASVNFERVSGALVSLRGDWMLQSDGDFTIAHYDIAIEPGLWVPNWIVRAALKHDLPRMLQSLRSNAEETRPDNLG